MTPPVVTLRITSLPLSAMYRLPLPSNAVWSGPRPSSGSATTGLRGSAFSVKRASKRSWLSGTSSAGYSWNSSHRARSRALAPGRPILIAETASADTGGSKADWNTALDYVLREKFALPNLDTHVREGTAEPVSIQRYFSEMLDQSMDWKMVEAIRNDVTGAMFGDRYL